MEKKKILITGASGTVGQEVLNQLSKKCVYELIVFDLENSKSKKIFDLYRNNLQWIAGSITNINDIQKIPSLLDVVIHLAAIIPPAADINPILTQKVNVEGTQNLLKHIEQTSPDAFFMYSSSVSVYGDRIQNPEIIVSDILKISEGDIYAQSKMDAEKMVRDSSLNWTIFRLSAIMKNHKLSKLMFQMPLETQLEICTPEDTALAFVNAIDNTDKLSNQIFNLGGGEKCCISYQEFLKRSFSIFGLRKLNFPKRAFADKNFHCGFYADGYVLENLLHFRKDTIETYFEKTSKSVSNLKKFFASILSPFIKWFLLLQSEPYKAYRTKDKVLINHFFRITNA
jgi:nucleoside-diphosphate-sugar epimerase